MRKFNQKYSTRADATTRAKGEDLARLIVAEGRRQRLLADSYSAGTNAAMSPNRSELRPRVESPPPVISSPLNRASTDARTGTRSAVDTRIGTWPVNESRGDGTTSGMPVHLSHSLGTSLRDTLIRHGSITFDLTETETSLDRPEEHPTTPDSGTHTQPHEDATATSNAETERRGPNESTRNVSHDERMRLSRVLHPGTTEGSTSV
ncbi:hypothetical protein I316_01593 [Kwoniella heveanensis BCC8398]|uniref:Uncharacterized protein n=1 Tax=Kwoniella heveanensis BCC8398 TaxID=1296120 RepID=A0A1B9H147_9TREE|nr:hypothetical protein I316_01593 [Kwoniella heveanensis BCC8398]